VGAVGSAPTRECGVESTDQRHGFARRNLLGLRRGHETIRVNLPTMGASIRAVSTARET